MAIKRRFWLVCDSCLSESEGFRSAAETVAWAKGHAWQVSQNRKTKCFKCRRVGYAKKQVADSGTKS